MAKKNSGNREEKSEDADKTRLSLNLSSKHLKTLDAISEKPVRSDIAWSDIEGLMRALE